MDLKPDLMIPPLLRQARKLFDLKVPPASREGCKNCELLSDLASAAGVTRAADAADLKFIVSGALKLAYGMARQ